MEISLNRQVKYFFMNFFERNEINWLSWQIHKFESVENDGKLIVTVTLGRPGLLIGKGGCMIDRIQNELTEFFEKPTKIHIQEYDIFYSND